MSDPAPHLRHTPVQARSRARREAILDAADAVFLEMGFAAATTNHVAARAGTSIGSLYRFFPDKEALLVALAQRYGDQMTAMAREVTAPRPEGWTLAELVGHGIEAFNAFLVASPGFLTLLEQAGHPALREGAAQHDDQMSALIGAVQARVAPDRPEEERAVVAEVTRVVLGALQGFSLRGDHAHRRRVVEELKLMIILYLGQRLGIDPHAPLPL